MEMLKEKLIYRELVLAKARQIEVNYIEFFHGFEDKYIMKTCSDLLVSSQATWKKINVRPETHSV